MFSVVTIPSSFAFLSYTHHGEPQLWCSTERYERRYSFPPSSSNSSSLRPERALGSLACSSTMPQWVGAARVFDIDQRLSLFGSCAVHEQLNSLSTRSKSIIRPADLGTSTRWRRLQRQSRLRTSAFHLRAGSDDITSRAVTDASDLSSNVGSWKESHNDLFTRRWSCAMTQSTMGSDLSSAAAGLLAAGVLSFSSLGAADAAAGKFGRGRR